jgi:prevent-host-death family protein
MKPKLQPRKVSKLRKAFHDKARARALEQTESAQVFGEAYMSASVAKNCFATVLENVSKGQQVFITKHNAAKAVVMSVEKYRSLSAATTSLLDQLTAEFDARFERMQTPEMRRGMQQAFDATADQLAKSAVKAGRIRS